MTVKRLEAKARKDALLIHAIALAAKVGYTNVTRAAIAEAAGVHFTLISYHFGTMTQFKRTLMREAVMRGATSKDARRVIAQGIMARDKHALRCDATLRSNAMAEAAV